MCVSYKGDVWFIKHLPGHIIKLSAFIFHVYVFFLRPLVWVECSCLMRHYCRNGIKKRLNLRLACARRLLYCETTRRRFLLLFRQFGAIASAHACKTECLCKLEEKGTVLMTSRWVSQSFAIIFIIIISQDPKWTCKMEVKQSKLNLNIIIHSLPVRIIVLYKSVFVNFRNIEIFLIGKAEITISFNFLKYS